MIRRGRPTLFVWGLGAVLALSIVLRGSPASADEEDDIQRQVDAQRSGVPDLEHLDRLHAATPDIQRLKEWIALAWELRNKHDPDAAREVLDRCLAQAELIRQIITASQMKAEVAARETKLQQTRQQIDQKKQAVREGQDKKKSIEQVVGS